MATPETPIYKLPFEAPGSLPGVTLTGGRTGTEERRLAEAVEDEFLRVDEDIQTVADAAAEAGLGWVPITSGVADAQSTFVIDATAGGKFPAGTFSLMRLHMHGRVDPTATLTLNINDSLDSESHKRFHLAFDLDGNLQDSGMLDSTVWRMGYWSDAFFAQPLTATLYQTHVSGRVAMQSESGYISNFTSSATKYWGYGRTNDFRLVQSLRVGTTSPNSAEYSETSWWLEGYRTGSE